MLIVRTVGSGCVKMKLLTTNTTSFTVSTTTAESVIPKGFGIVWVIMSTWTSTELFFKISNIEWWISKYGPSEIDCRISLRWNKYFIISLHIKRQSEAIQPSTFNIHYSIFVIYIDQQPILGTNINIKCYLFGSGLSDLGSIVVFLQKSLHKFVTSSRSTPAAGRYEAWFFP